VASKSEMLFFLFKSYFAYNIATEDKYYATYYQSSTHVCIKKKKKEEKKKHTSNS
jgi:hypothetical protein